MSSRAYVGQRWQIQNDFADDAELILHAIARHAGFVRPWDRRESKPRPVPRVVRARQRIDSLRGSGYRLIVG
jgi:hypothetical protein